MSGNGNVKHLYTCRFCNKRVAEAYSLSLPIIGDPGKPAKEMQSVMLRHMGKHHPDQFARGAALLDELLTFLAFNAFETTDPSVPPRLERIRAAIFAEVRKNTIQDSALDSIVAEHGFEDEDARKIRAILRAVRDVCCETGPYASDNPPAPQSALIAP